MNIKPSKPISDRPLPPVGMQHAVLYQVICLGTQKGDWQGKPTFNYKIKVGWELPNAPKIIYKNDDGTETKKLACIFMTYNSYLTDKSTLGIHLGGFIGRKFTKKEQNSFNIGDILKPGLNSLLTIIHDVKMDGSPCAKYTAIAPLMAGMVEIAAENAIIEYEPTMGDNFPEGMPDWAIDEVKQSPEYNTAVNGAANFNQAVANNPVAQLLESDGTVVDADVPYDDIPF